jgi:polygalacturonase
VDDVHCYGSHGLSVGSQTAGGVGNVLFENSTLDGFDSFGNLSGSDTGIQVKTDANSGGLTRRVTYRDICMTSIKHLLIFNPHYSSGGTSAPTQRDIVLNGIVATDSESGAYSIFEGFDAAHRWASTWRTLTWTTSPRTVTTAARARPRARARRSS